MKGNVNEIRRGEEELDRDDDSFWQAADCVSGIRQAGDHKSEADEMERLENWNARIAKLFIGGGGGGETAPLAEDTADVVFKVQLNDGGAGEEVLFKVRRISSYCICTNKMESLRPSINATGSPVCSFAAISRLPRHVLWSPSRDNKHHSRSRRYANSI